MQRRRFLKPAAAIAALFAKTADGAVGGGYERYKASNVFDGTVHNPQHLG